MLNMWQAISWTDDDHFPNAYIDGLVQERHESIANALELHLSFTKPSICADHE